jgi:hypothetical protein
MISQDRSRRRARGIVATAILTLALPVALASPATPASAAVDSPNPVIVWDRNAQEAIWDVAGQAPQNVSGRSFTMVSGAVYDAVNAIAGTPYEPYLVAPGTNGRESTDAAVAAAAYRVLKSLFPDQRQRLRAQYRDYLAGIPGGWSKQAGIKVGEQTAAAMIASRENDGAFGDQLWPEGDAPGQWRPTPPAFLNVGAWSAEMKPFLIPDPSMFGTAGPPALTSRTYARDVNEVMRLGSADSAARTADQTEAAIWWHDRRAPGWEIKRQLAITQRLSVLETARLFAMAIMVNTDAGGVACNVDRRFWSFWRPVTAIRLADTDGNPRTVPDPEWTPLLVTPPIPEYPSGNTCANGGTMALYESFFGRDDIAFSGFSAETGTRRHFSSFSQAVEEVIGARIWGGIHFRTADVRGVELGQAVAGYVVENHFRPLR